MILVTGATGNVGSHIVSELRARGAPTRAFVRNRAKAKERLGAGVGLAEGDFADRGSLDRALDGVDAVLLTSADSPAKVEHETAIIDAAAAVGVRRIVKLSTIGAQVGSPLPTFDWHGRIEHKLAASGVPAVVLQSCFYMSNLFLAAEQVARGQLTAPAGEGRIAMIEPRDVAAVAAIALTEEGHEGETYTLTGPEAIGYAQVADVLSAVTGRSVEFVDAPPTAAREAMAVGGLPDWLVEQLDRIFGLVRDGSLAPTTDTVRAITGREPHGFADFARDHAPIFRAEPVATGG